MYESQNQEPSGGSDVLHSGSEQCGLFYLKANVSTPSIRLSGQRDPMTSSLQPLLADDSEDICSIWAERFNLACVEYEITSNDGGKWKPALFALEPVSFELFLSL